MFQLGWNRHGTAVMECKSGGDNQFLKLSYNGKVLECYFLDAPTG
ncbi:unnamed protein product [Chondrus crispus]|uniref:Uncharacterized protein n=1 Tax=Chondrus crispus TaxID=2769 RepID=R7QBW4_CHOCR|nr:unnamed protein product [Chondrus crispus]CDF34955.1 unnamed protein product [Chondrus crispus]|eukprot:XP_005714774.1 unnamed protein product [Chondrus crispus]